MKIKQDTVHFLSVTDEHFFAELLYLIIEKRERLNCSTMYKEVDYLTLYFPITTAK